ncbi:diguanylate cyclase [Rhodosalinus sp.]|uniref:diguanylate cyclase n=1 Tax=Rhodosalinus sp. TaxID=2047741 RepID=UPI003567D2BB
MTGTILIAEAVATRRIALRARIANAFRRVLIATTAEEAIREARAEPPEIVLVASDLPGMAAAELQRRLAGIAPDEAPPALAVMTPAGDRAACFAALGAGADDAIARTTPPALMLARLRARLRDREDAAELRLREATRRALGFAEPAATFEPPARLALLAPDARSARARAAALSAAVGAPVRALDRQAALALGPGDRLDALVLAAGHGAATGAALVPALRAQAATRTAALLVQTAGAGAEAEAAQALDLGAQDALAGSFDADEIALRLAARLAAKRRADRLRADLREGLDAAVTDPLTGLYNRRFAMPELARLTAEAARERQPLSVLIADLDHFKAVNDAQGHAAGDHVLAETAARLRAVLGADGLAARIGGEEFLVALPGADASAAQAVAERLCARVAATPVPLPSPATEVGVTVSIGLATLMPSTTASGAPARAAEALLAEADAALYGAKARGRNRVSTHRPAA